MHCGILLGGGGGVHANVKIRRRRICKHTDPPVPINPSYNSTNSSIIPITYPLTTRVVGAPQMTSQPVSSILLCFPLPSKTWWTPRLSVSWCFCAVPWKIVLAGPDEEETGPFHFSLRLFMMVRRSSCGLIACWILAQTSLLVIWSLYGMCSICQ